MVRDIFAIQEYIQKVMFETDGITDNTNNNTGEYDDLSTI